MEGGATFTSLGYNLTNSGAGTPFTATGDITNTNPLLGPLADNGGSTWTHALLPASPAIGRIPFGVNGCGTTVTTDQRGVTRPQGPACDVGSYELMVNQPPAITSANSATFVVGAAGTFTVTATGFPTPTITLSDTLPGGVTFSDNGTATLAGTPASGTVGVYPLTFTASNGILPDATQNFTLTVNTRIYLPLVLRQAL